jgi:hypothetical protein
MLSSAQATQHCLVKSSSATKLPTFQGSLSDIAYPMGCLVLFLFAMKKTLFVLLTLPLSLFAQKHDYIWVTGDSNNPNDTTKGGLVIDFHQNPPYAYYNYRELNLRTCNASICDTAGNLLFYTNGCDIGGADDEILDNGEGINLGNVYQAKCEVENYYTSGYQSVIILPVPDSSNLYYLFHKKIIYTYNPFDIKVEKLFFSKVDMSENNGKGKVVAKNVEIMSEDIAYGELTAVKHTNGNDWWLVTPKRNSNTFYSFLFTKDGIIDTLVNTIGTIPKKQAEGGMQVVFSPDGSKYFRSVPSGPVMMYDFDRATGVFTDFDTIHVDYANWPSIANGCAVSPNGRFFYVCAELNIFQFDLWAVDISASQVTVAEWDGFQAPVATIFGQSQLGPDCKIYVSTIDSKYYHVINNPDEPGLACNVTQHSFVFPTPTGASIPSFPNYRLGPLDNPGVPCTATVSAVPPLMSQHEIKVYPNPTRDHVTLDWATTGAAAKRLLLRNALGQPLKDIALNGGSNTRTLSVRDVSPGIYFWVLLAADGQPLGAGKIIKL